LAIGVNHQSNGRSEPLSRSWNRLVAQLGVERGDVALLLRPWWRLPESASSDDNPDITRYIGNGELVAVWAPGENTYSLTLRGSARSGRGAAQASWNFPLARRVRGTLHLFSGYGDSLIDYNVKQTTIGFGISLADHL
jgi:phospholipase A1